MGGDHSVMPRNSQNAATQPKMPSTIMIQQMRFQRGLRVSGLNSFAPAPYCKKMCSKSATRDLDPWRGTGAWQPPIRLSLSPNSSWVLSAKRSHQLT